MSGADCEARDGAGKVWNNADPTSGQFVECEECQAPKAAEWTATDWIEWNGGICPVAPTDALVMVRLRNGCESDGPAIAGYFRWDHGRTPDSPLKANDIVAYRVVQS